MKLKPILITVGILAVLAAIGWWIDKKGSGNKEDADSRTGQNLLAPETLSAAWRIVLSKDSESQSTVLQLGKDGTWVLPDYYELPVDFTKLQSLTRNLLEANIRRLVSRRSERLARLELENSRIVLLTEDGETLWNLEIGKSGPSGGYFIHYDGEEAAYLADLNIYLDADSENWANKKILPFEPEDVSEVNIDFSNTEPSLKFHRTSVEEDFQSTGLAEDQSVNTQEVKNLISSFINGRFNNVADNNEPDVVSARTNSRKMTIKLFQGDSYELAIGRRPAEPVIAEGEDEEKGEDEDEEMKSEMTDPGPVYIFYECSDPDNRINQVMKLASLSYSDYIYSQLPETREDLIDTIAPQEPSSDVIDAEKEIEK